MNTLEKCAEILVECGKAIRWRNPVDPKFTGIIMVLTEADVDGDYGEFNEWCNPFADTLEGRRQADAIESYLIQTNFHREFNVLTAKPEVADFHQWRLDRIKWCIEQLINEHT